MVKKSKVFVFCFIFLVTTLLFSNFVLAATPGEVLSNFGNWLKGFFSSIFHFLFGPMPSDFESKYGGAQSRIVLVAIWVMILATFYDIISNFSTFGKFTSLAVSFASALIAANLGWIASALIYITGVFVAVGAIAIYIGLFGAFIVFIIANLGITKFSGWILKRQLMIKVAKEDALSAAGAANIASAVTNLRTVEKSFSSKSP